MPDWIPDLLFIIGSAAICAGLGLIWMPLALISGGAFALYASWRSAK